MIIKGLNLLSPSSCIKELIFMIGEEIMRDILILSSTIPRVKDIRIGRGRIGEEEGICCHI